MPESGSNPDFFFLISYCSFLSCIVCIYSICSSFTLYSCSFINLTNIIFDMIKKNSHLLSINDPGIPHGYKGLFLDNGYMIKHNYVDGFRLKSDLYININLQKKMEVKEYPHVFPTWEIFPRAHYFKNRYVDLHLRFNKVMSALPKRFHRKDLMSQLDILSRCLRSFLQVTVIGMEDMAVGQFIVSTEALEKHTDLPGPVNEGIHICICHAKIRDLGELGKQDIGVIVDSVSKGFLQRCTNLSNIFFFCETKNNEFNENNAEKFRTDLLPTLQKLNEHCHYPLEILIGPKEGNLPSSVSNAIEKQIIDGFHDVFMFLQTFIRKDCVSYQENLDILESDLVVGTIKEFLRNGDSLVDSEAVSEHISFFDMIIQTLCHQTMCAAVSPMAAKHNIPEWVCHGLLEEINFEKELQKSMSKNTIHHLKEFEKYTQNLVIQRAEGKTVEGSSQNKYFSFDFIYYKLKEDLSEAVTSAEKKLAAMNRITIVMRKMVFEVRGYLKQTVVTIEILESGQRKLALEDITDKMREDIMGTKVVYGMRTLYGQLEIHLKMGLDEATLTDAKDNINQIMKTHRFSHPFTIKTVDKAPQILARDFYEQGDIIFSPFPDNGEQIRKGTLGCFIKSTDGVTYGVTCAHVVDPHENNEHKVYIRSPDCLFAISNPNMIVYGRDKDQYLTDFTAIRVVPEKLNMCSFYFKDESGNNKNVKLSRESSSELVGSYVLKYGAATGCTNGIIASNSYIFGGQSSIEHLVIVEPLPVTSDEVCDILTNGSSNSLPSTQGELPIAPAEGAQTDTEEPDVVDLLYITSTDIV
ncbi:uncharacterized protein LOC123549671 isoform X2 [Mercenaria mercenaria]|uniref:uncharacterized protein LOC123549671 isoform X2 n=2 Tax=Mercenaria mercenaria TaxID=6596 RepID=UPI00234FAA47|nr:uncharacterized protein LOC123549671 isoform X2 [Mercenaria mercenaria]